MLYVCLWQMVPSPVLYLKNPQKYVWGLSVRLLIVVFSGGCFFSFFWNELWKLNFLFSYEAPVKALMAWHSLSLSFDFAISIHVNVRH